MPKHDEPHSLTAYTAGQTDYINRLSPDAKRYHITDAHRLAQYRRGYEAERNDCEFIVDAIGR